MMGIHPKKQLLPRLLLMVNARKLKRRRMQSPLRPLLSGRKRRGIGGRCRLALLHPTPVRLLPISSKALLFLRLRLVHLRWKRAWSRQKYTLQCPFPKGCLLVRQRGTRCLGRHRLSPLLLRSLNLKYACRLRASSSHLPIPIPAAPLHPLIQLPCTSSTNGVFRRYLNIHLILSS